ncbi:MAG: CinA family nicotinamide mononucleotide deamidase-related protein [Alphaproteobacteria bacterium]
MRCEVVAVGTELLLGQIVDTNSSWIGEQLALAGIDSHFQTKVGDNLGRMVESIRLGLERSDAVITCGGLGPTQDDITREAICEIMGVSMTRMPEIGDKIRAMFESRGRVMTENNLQQADVPDGATTIAEMPGTAPGLVCPVGDKVIYAVPGVPFEMRIMMQGTILPDLQRRAGVTAVIKSRVLKTWGHTESGLAELLAGRIDELDRTGKATIAFQASGIEGLKVRLTAKAVDEAAAHAILAEEEAQVRALLGDVVFATDDQTMESALLDTLRADGLTLAVAEAVTGGLVASRMTGIDGAGEVLRGTVAAAPDGIPADLLGLDGVSQTSPEAAMAMADGVRRLFGAEVGIATAWAPAPDAPGGQRKGTVYLGLALDNQTLTEEVRLPGDHQRIRQYAVISLLNYLRKTLGRRADKAA